MSLCAASASTRLSLKRAVKAKGGVGPSPGIFARNCSVHRIDKACAAAFLDANHRLGSTGSRYRYGLFVERSTGKGEEKLPEGTLVAVATFSNARRWIKDGVKISSYEWVRYASLPGLRVIGGMGKLLCAFIDEVNPDDIMSYADAQMQDGGEAYRRLGFVEEGIVEGEGYRNVKFRLRPVRK